MCIQPSFFFRPGRKYISPNPQRNNSKEASNAGSAMRVLWASALFNAVYNSHICMPAISISKTMMNNSRPSELVRHKSSATGHFLKRYIDR